MHAPGNNGGALFGTVVRATTGLVYVVGQNNPSPLRLYKPGEGRVGAVAGLPAMPGQMITRASASPVTAWIRRRARC